MGNVELNEDFEPKIITFLCKWCLRTRVDSPQTVRIKYPANISSLEFMCSSRIDIGLVIETLAKGADGVLIACCKLGDCHHGKGNYIMQKKYALMIKLLHQLGIEEKRVRLELISALESEKFEKIVQEMVEEIRKLGPNPLKER